MKQTPPIAASEPLPVEVLVVLESFTRTDVGAAPPAVTAAIDAELALRNLVPRELAVDADLSAVRSTDARLARLSDGPHLLVEVAPRFSSQLQSRYRWTVEVTATTSDPRASRSFTVPVHLLYAHEGEDRAALEAAPVVARQVGGLLDEWLASRP